MADGIVPQTDTLESLAARVAFLEQWAQIPVQHLPGYVAPAVPEVAQVVESVSGPAEE